MAPSSGFSSWALNRIGDPEFGLERFCQRNHIALITRIETGQRLVQQQQLRAADHCLRQQAGADARRLKARPRGAAPARRRRRDRERDRLRCAPPCPGTAGRADGRRRQRRQNPGRSDAGCPRHCASAACIRLPGCRAPPAGRARGCCRCWRAPAPGWRASMSFCRSHWVRTRRRTHRPRCPGSRRPAHRDRPAGA